MRRLQEAGHTAYLVGGGVRDLFLGKTPKDYDISTDARPGELRKIFRNSRTIGRRFRLVQVFFPGNKIIEVSTFRCRSEYDLEGKDVVLAANNTYGDERDDAFRRDLTINGLFYEIKNQTIIDYVGGVQDLKDQVVRIIGDARRRISRDPVRMMRAVRHAARSCFRIEEQTWEAIKAHTEALAVCPVSRVRDELFKDLRGGASSLWLKIAADCGLLSVLIPCYKGMLDAPMVTSLQSYLAVTDRLWAKGVVFEDDVYLSILLLPWARKTCPELSAPLKIGEAFALARKIRDYLSTDLAHIDINRATKERIAHKLALLPLFEQNFSSKGWPSWLKKKSYFQDHLLFYHLCAEAAGGEPVDADLFPKPVQRPERPSRSADKKPRRQGQGPSWAKGKQKGGVFGFKR
ncbi:MAG: CCA tRNA nucleotidyltransferase [Proteobacteria bacterium]|nr:CCA tRNA nucleotidyltransferase [Pseudomonadota bacterium]MBU1639772.1 CCA tRNA nucleotidyltransferase [Pseudomonadota bacterium]